MSSTMDQAFEIAQGPFAPTWESLRQFRCPEWFRDAKLGIWSHWGPQSVPMYGDWYARRMYIPGEPQYLHHWRVYGHPSRSGYKDIVPMWKAEKFDPEALMDLYVQAGARYFFAQAMHHDNFDNFDSTHNPWNSVRVGPMKDIVALWRDAARARNLRFGLSEHLGASFNWFGVNKNSDSGGPYAGVPYDGNDLEYGELYHRGNEGADIYKDGELTWLTDNEAFQAHWFARIKDVIDRYQPDVLYTDGGVQFGEIGLRIIAHLYNTSAAIHGSNQAVYNQKDVHPEVYIVGVLDIERGQRNEIAEHVWQTDTSVGDWFYDVRDVYKTPRQVLETLVDIVSKNGNLMLNIPQRPDGTIDDECTYLLRRMAAWMAQNAEGIFGSRPWEVAGEGMSVAEEGAFKEAAVDWSPADFRLTRKGETIFAYQMRWPEDGQAMIHSLALNRTRPVSAVRLLGYGSVPFEQTEVVLRIMLPQFTPVEGPHGFAIEQS